MRLSEYRQRIFDETYNVRLNSGLTNKVSILSVVTNVFKASLKDSVKIISDKDFIIKLIKDDISLCKFYESRINLF